MSTVAVDCFCSDALADAGPRHTAIVRFPHTVLVPQTPHDPIAPGLVSWFSTPRGGCSVSEEQRTGRRSVRSLSHRPAACTHQPSRSSNGDTAVCAKLSDNWFYPITLQ